MPFQPGQRVVCVNVTPMCVPVLKVRKGGVYTVKGYTPCGALLLEGIDPYPWKGWWDWRFRPVTDRPTSIEVFRSLLVPSKDKVLT